MVEHVIRKNFNEIQQCPDRYQGKGFCISYFFKVFNEYPSIPRIEKKDYLEKIKTFHDPILKYVALYLYRNFIIAKNYIKNDLNPNNIDACIVLNRWLDQEKNFYTDNGKYYYNRRWWNISIEPLWKRLKGYYHDKTCERINSYNYVEAGLKYPDEDGRWYLHMPEDNICYKENDDENSIKDNCAKLSILFYLGEKYKLLGKTPNEQQTATNDISNITDKYCPAYPGNAEKIYYNSMLKAEKLCFCISLLNKIAIPIIVTVLGTIFLAFFFK